jgi:hypothetical protein
MTTGVLINAAGKPAARPRALFRAMSCALMPSQPVGLLSWQVPSKHLPRLVVLTTQNIYSFLNTLISTECKRALLSVFFIHLSMCVINKSCKGTDILR